MKSPYQSCHRLRNVEGKRNFPRLGKSQGGGGGGYFESEKIDTLKKSEGKLFEIIRHA